MDECWHNTKKQAILQKIWSVPIVTRISAFHGSMSFRSIQLNVERSAASRLRRGKKTNEGSRGKGTREVERDQHNVCIRKRSKKDGGKTRKVKRRKKSKGAKTHETRIFRGRQKREMRTCKGERIERKGNGTKKGGSWDSRERKMREFVTQVFVSTQVVVFWNT